MNIIVLIMLCLLIAVIDNSGVLLDEPLEKLLYVEETVDEAVSSTNTVSSGDKTDTVEDVELGDDTAAKEAEQYLKEIYKEGR